MVAREKSPHSCIADVRKRIIAIRQLPFTDEVLLQWTPREVIFNSVAVLNTFLRTGSSCRSARAKEVGKAFHVVDLRFKTDV